MKVSLGHCGPIVETQLSQDLRSTIHTPERGLRTIAADTTLDVSVKECWADQVARRVTGFSIEER